MNIKIKNRCEQRKFWCSNALYDELKKECNGLYSASTYIRIAVLEKLKRDHPDKLYYYEGLL